MDTLAGPHAVGSDVWLMQAKMYATGNELDLYIRLYEALYAVHGSPGLPPSMIGGPRQAGCCCER